MSRTLKLAILTTSAVAFLALLRPAFADGKAIPGYRPAPVATKAAPVVVKGGATVVRPTKRYTPYKTYGFRTGPTIKYHDGHPIPGGGWCHLGGWHVHTYAPLVNPHWVLDGGGYVYLGVVPDVVVVEPLPPPVVVAPAPPPVVYVDTTPRIVWIDEPGCREKVEYKKDGYKIEYKCKHHDHGKHKGWDKHGKHHDDD